MVTSIGKASERFSFGHRREPVNVATRLNGRQVHTALESKGRFGVSRMSLRGPALPVVNVRRTAGVLRKRSYDPADADHCNLGLLGHSLRPMLFDKRNSCPRSESMFPSDMGPPNGDSPPVAPPRAVSGRSGPS